MAGLRLKLETDPLHPRHLLTVRTAGYLLRQEPEEA
jgi:DNA-binding response OmpR family regulator